MITEDTTVAEILQSHEGAQAALSALGIDTCCGGTLTLKQAASLRGVPAAEIVASLRRAHEAGVPRPDVACRTPRGDAAPPLFRRFLVVALVATMTLGAAFGAYNLVMVHFALGVNPPAHNAFHANFQMLGFVLLSIVGVSFQVVPRFLGLPLLLPRVARTSFWLLLGGLVARGYGQFGEMLPGTLAAGLAGSLLLLAGVMCWAASLHATWSVTERAPEPFHAFLGAGTLSWIAGAAILVAGALRAFRTGDPDDAIAFNEPFYVAALFGGTLSWIQGILLHTRLVPLSRDARGRRIASTALGLVAAGTAVAVASRLWRLHDAADALYSCGLLMVAASLGTLVIGARRSGEECPLHRAGGRFGRIMRMAFASAALFACLALLRACLLVAGRSVPRLLDDGMRHAFALGFVSLVIMAMAGRMLPALRATRLQWPDVHYAATHLIAAGVVLRQAQVVAALGGPSWLMNVSGASGPIAALGVVLAASALLRTLAAGSTLSIVNRPHESPFTPLARQAVTGGAA